MSITAGCPFVDYWGACLIGGMKCNRSTCHIIIIDARLTNDFCAQLLVLFSITLAAGWSTSLTSRTQLVLYLSTQYGRNSSMKLTSAINVYTFFVVPPHAICSGLWSIIATALFLVGPTANCNLHAAFEGLCYCILRLPPLVSDIMT